MRVKVALRIILLCVACMVGSNCFSVAESLDDAIHYLNAGDFQSAEQLLLPLAMQGDTKAQFTLGTTYENAGNPLVAQSWYEMAADKGHPESAYALGNFYRLGIGGKPDYSLAAKWYQRAAEGDFAPAQRELAALYTQGRGVEANIDKAFFWIEKAANNGDSIGQYYLGFSYAKGIGTRQSDKKAIDWLQAAARNGLLDAEISLGEHAFIQKDHRLAEFWLKKAALSGVVGAQYTLGINYIFLPVKDNADLSYAWISIAAEQGHGNAKMTLDTLSKSFPVHTIEKYKKLAERLKSDIRSTTPNLINKDYNGIEFVITAIKER